MDDSTCGGLLHGKHSQPAIHRNPPEPGFIPVRHYTKSLDVKLIDAALPLAVMVSTIRNRYLHMRAYTPAACSKEAFTDVETDSVSRLKRRRCRVEFYVDRSITAA